MSDDVKLLEVENLKTHFVLNNKRKIKAVDGVSFSIGYGETFGLVGESGCGKTTIGRSILQLVPVTEGHVYFKGTNLTKLKKKKLLALRKEMQIVFQDPYGSLNPRKTIGQMIDEPLLVHKMFDSSVKRRQRVIELIEMVGLNADIYDRYPHEFSGGQRQRIVIARALALTQN